MAHEKQGDGARDDRPEEGSDVVQDSCCRPGVTFLFGGFHRSAPSSAAMSANESGSDLGQHTPLVKGVDLDALGGERWEEVVVGIAWQGGQ